MIQRQEDTRGAVLFMDQQQIPAEVLSVQYTASRGEDRGGLGLGCALSAWVKLTLVQSDRSWKHETFSLTLDGVPMGTFRVTSAEEQEGTTRLEAYDAMTWAMEAALYQPGEETSTALSVLREAAEQAGLTLGAVEAGFADLPVTGLDKGYTCREMAGYMAGLLGCWAYVDREGRLALGWYQETGITIGPDLYYEGGLKLEDRESRVTGLVCQSCEGEETLTAGELTDPAELENPFMTAQRLELLLDRAAGLIYRPGEVSCYGQPGLEAGDLVQVTDRTGRTGVLPVMTLEQSWDGGLKTGIKASAPEGDRAVGSSSAGGVTQRLDRLAIRVADADHLAAEYMTASNARMDRLEAEKADIDLLNVGTADIDTLLVRSGLVTGELSGVTVNASKYITGVTIVGDLVKADTLSAKSIILEGEDGLFYQLNARGGELSAEELSGEQCREKLDGSVLAAGSVTADRINVTDLFAQDITATGTIRGITLSGTRGEIGGWEIQEEGLVWQGENCAIALRPAGEGGRVLEIVSTETEDPDVFYLDSYARLAAPVVRTGELIFMNPGQMEVGDPVIGMLLRKSAEEGGGIRCSGGSFWAEDGLYNGTFPLPRVQRGRLTVSASGSSNTDFTVTFPQAFDATPDIFLTLQHNSTVRFDYKVKSRSATGFTGTVYSYASSGTLSANVGWLAVID